MKGGFNQSNKAIVALIVEERAFYGAGYLDGAHSPFGQCVLGSLREYPESTNAVEAIRAFSSEILPRLAQTERYGKEAQSLLAKRKSIIEANVNLVKKWASIIQRQWIRSSFEYMDLFQEGILGITKALDRFDPDKGFQFSTYASYWIKHSIVRAVAIHDSVVRSPINMYAEIQEIEVMKKRLQCELHRDPTDREISDRILRMTEGRVKSRLENGPKPKVYSLDEQVPRSSAVNSFMTWKDLILAEHTGEYVDRYTTTRCRHTESYYMMMSEATNVDTAIDNAKTTSYICSLLDTLTPREKLVITSRYGLLGEETQTLKQIGDRLGLTRERIRQIELQAIGKLRRQARRVDAVP